MSAMLRATFCPTPTASLRWAALCAPPPSTNCPSSSTCSKATWPSSAPAHCSPSIYRFTARSRRAHEVRPGITGWAQCHGRNAITWTEKFKLDVWYVNNLSFLLDIKIIISTIQIVLSGKGVSQEGHATMEPFNGHN